MNGTLTPIERRIEELRPHYGPGNTQVCQHCVEQHKMDVEHRIVEELRKRSFPSTIVNDVDEWTVIRDLLKILEAQHSE